MTTQIAFLIPPRFLKAAALFASPDVTRYVLNGVNVEITTDSVLIVGTDGRRLFAVNVTEHVTFDGDRPEPTSFIIPTSLLASLPKERAKGCGVRIAYDGETVSASGSREIREKAINGNFPSWRHVTPTTEANPVSSININGRFLDSFAKANEMLSASRLSSPGLTVTQHVAGGLSMDGPLSILPSERGQNWFGVLMPLRSSDARLPEWSKKVTTQEQAA